MRAIIQRVTKASVTVGDELISSIGKGLCVLIGISRDDTPKEREYLARKILNLRLFDDDSGKRWAQSAKDRQLEILCVSQFTLYSILKGNKPDFHQAMGGDQSEVFYNEFLDMLRKDYDGVKIKDGKFGAHMQVHIQNDGPVTIQLECPPDLVDREGGEDTPSSKARQSRQELFIVKRQNRDMECPPQKEMTGSPVEEGPVIEQIAASTSQRAVPRSTETYLVCIVCSDGKAQIKEHHLCNSMCGSCGKGVHQRCRFLHSCDAVDPQDLDNAMEHPPPVQHQLQNEHTDNAIRVHGPTRLCVECQGANPTILCTGCEQNLHRTCQNIHNCPAMPKETYTSLSQRLHRKYSKYGLHAKQAQPNMSGLTDGNQPRRTIRLERYRQKKDCCVCSRRGIGLRRRSQTVCFYCKRGLHWDCRAKHICTLASTQPHPKDDGTSNVVYIGGNKRGRRDCCVCSSRKLGQRHRSRTICTFCRRGLHRACEPLHDCRYEKDPSKDSDMQDPFIQKARSIERNEYGESMSGSNQISAAAVEISGHESSQGSSNQQFSSQVRYSPQQHVAQQPQLPSLKMIRQLQRRPRKLSPHLQLRPPSKMLPQLLIKFPRKMSPQSSFEPPHKMSLHNQLRPPRKTLPHLQRQSRDGHLQDNSEAQSLLLARAQAEVNTVLGTQQKNMHLARETCEINTAKGSRQKTTTRPRDMKAVEAQLSNALSSSKISPPVIRISVHEMRDGRKDCVICSRRMFGGGRKRAYYQCSGCRKGLHPRCQPYHACGEDVSPNKFDIMGAASSGANTRENSEWSAKETFESAPKRQRVAINALRAPLVKCVPQAFKECVDCLLVDGFKKQSSLMCSVCNQGVHKKCLYRHQCQRLGEVNLVGIQPRGQETLRGASPRGTNRAENFGTFVGQRPSVIPIGFQEMVEGKKECDVCSERSSDGKRSRSRTQCSVCRKGLHNRCLSQHICPGPTYVDDREMGTSQVDNRPAEGTMEEVIEVEDDDVEELDELPDENQTGRLPLNESNSAEDAEPGTSNAETPAIMALKRSLFRDRRQGASILIKTGKEKHCCECDGEMKTRMTCPMCKGGVHFRCEWRHKCKLTQGNRMADQLGESFTEAVVPIKGDEIKTRKKDCVVCSNRRAGRRSRASTKCPHCERGLHRICATQHDCPVIRFLQEQSQDMSDEENSTAGYVEVSDGIVRYCCVCSSGRKSQMVRTACSSCDRGLHPHCVTLHNCHSMVPRMVEVNDAYDYHNDVVEIYEDSDDDVEIYDDHADDIKVGNDEARLMEVNEAYDYHNDVVHVQMYEDHGDDNKDGIIEDRMMQRAEMCDDQIEGDDNKFMTSNTGRYVGQDEESCVGRNEVDEETGPSVPEDAKQGVQASLREFETGTIHMEVADSYGASSAQKVSSGALAGTSSDASSDGSEDLVEGKANPTTEGVKCVKEEEVEADCDRAEREELMSGECLEANLAQILPQSLQRDESTSILPQEGAVESSRPRDIKNEDADIAEECLLELAVEEVRCDSANLEGLAFEACAENEGAEDDLDAIVATMQDEISQCMEERGQMISTSSVEEAIVVQEGGARSLI